MQKILGRGDPPLHQSIPNQTSKMFAPFGATPLNGTFSSFIGGKFKRDLVVLKRFRPLEVCRVYRALK
jgi:hypothetical protein